MTTFFLLVLPLECRRIEAQIIQVLSYSTDSNNGYSSVLQILGNKSVALGIFAAIAGLAQLISPLIGLLSDCYNPPKRYQYLFLLGKRLPYIFLGTILTLLGISWEYISSSAAAQVHYDPQLIIPMSLLSEVLWPWFHYFMAFLLHNLGLNIVYTVMMCLIPDLVPTAQIGQANGIFALLLVLGSLFGFAIFQTVVSDGSFFSNEAENNNDTSNGGVVGMYKVYFGVSTGAMALTYHFVMQRLEQIRIQHQNQNSTMSPLSTSHPITTTSNQESIPIQPSNMHEEEKERSNSPFPPIPDSYPSSILTSHSSNHTTNTTHAKASVVSTWPPIHLFIYFLLYKPIATKSMSEIRSAYWVESTGVYHDFFIVTISRLFYYMGISSQTFFLYFVHDAVINNSDDLNENTTTSTYNNHPLSSILNHPEVTVAVLAIIGQTSGALTCYPVGLLSDKYFGGRRKPFVYLSCLLLSMGYLILLLSKTLNQIMGICILLGAANGMYLTMDTSLAVDTLPSSSIPILDHSTSDHSLHDLSFLDHDEEVNGKKMMKKERIVLTEQNLDKPQSTKASSHGAAQLLGVWGVFGFIGSSVGPLIGGMVLFALGRPSDIHIDTYYSTRGYTILFSLSACYFFCAAISLTYIQRKGV